MNSNYEDDRADKKGGIKTSQIKRIFYGNFEKTYSCECEDKSYDKSFEEFECLKLKPEYELNENKFYKLKDFLNDICLQEDQSPRKCDVCKKHITETKTISELPPVLIIQIGRVIRINGKTTKITDKVEFPVKLNMNEFVPKSNNIAMYSLYGICNHIGDDFNTGHYEAICKNINEEVWYKFNDAFCNKIIIEMPSVNSDEAYLLFYSNSNRSNYKYNILKQLNPQL